MRIEQESRVEQPAKVILGVMIDEMEKIVPFMPSVESITTKTFERRPDGKVHILRRWQGTADSAPAALRPFVSKDSLAWNDDALWYPDQFKVEWKLSTSLSKFYECSGTNYFEPHPAAPEKATRMRITGELTVFPDKLPGVPTFLGKKLAPQVEGFVVKLISPNLTNLATGLDGYFRSLAAKK